MARTLERVLCSAGPRRGVPRSPWQAGTPRSERTLPRPTATGAEGPRWAEDNTKTEKNRWRGTCGTGWALLCAASVQEAQDLALIAHAATLEARLPFIHFFDGFRTSHEVATIVPLSSEHVRAMIDDRLVLAHRAHGLSPEHP